MHIIIIFFHFLPFTVIVVVAFAKTCTKTCTKALSIIFQISDKVK